MQGKSYLNDIVWRWVDGSLANILRDDEEVVPLRQRYGVVDHSSGWGVSEVRPFTCVEPSVDPLVDDDEGQLRLDLQVLEYSTYVGDLCFLDVSDLSLAHAIAIDNDPLRDSPCVVPLVTVIEISVKPWKEVYIRKVLTYASKARVKAWPIETCSSSFDSWMQTVEK